MKRKRKSRIQDDEKPGKRVKTVNAKVCHPVLEKYYRRVTSLREYLFSALASSSRQRKRLLAERVIVDCNNTSTVDLLDAILVCNVNANPSTRVQVQDSDRRLYSQQVAESTGESVGKSQSISQAEVSMMLLCLVFTHHTWYNTIHSNMNPNQ